MAWVLLASFAFSWLAWTEESTSGRIVLVVIYAIVVIGMISEGMRKKQA